VQIENSARKWKSRTPKWIL